MLMCGFAGVRPGERVVRYEDTDEGSVIHEQQLARQQQLKERRQEQTRRGKASDFFLHSQAYTHDFLHTGIMCVSVRVKHNICIAHHAMGWLQTCSSLVHFVTFHDQSPK